MADKNGIQPLKILATIPKSPLYGNLSQLRVTLEKADQ